MACGDYCNCHAIPDVITDEVERHHTLTASSRGVNWKFRLCEADSETSYSRALNLLEGTLRWLHKLSLGAAASLEEGLAETLTVIRLGVPPALRRTLSSTNVIESALSVTRIVTARVKRWRDGDMRARWCAAGLRRAEEKFRRVKGYRQIPQLLAALDATQLDAKPKVG